MSTRTAEYYRNRYHTNEAARQSAIEATRQYKKKRREADPDAAAAANAARADAFRERYRTDGAFRAAYLQAQALRAQKRALARVAAAVTTSHKKVAAVYVKAAESEPCHDGDRTDDGGTPAVGDRDGLDSRGGVGCDNTVA